MYRDTHELNTSLRKILISGLEDDSGFHSERARLAYHLAHFNAEKCFYKWDWASNEERGKMIDGFLIKHSLKPNKKLTDPEEAQKLLEEDYLSFEHLESVYKHMIKMIDGEIRLSEIEPEPITYPQRQYLLLSEEHNL